MTATARVGRPRDPRIDDAVREATLRLLAERGYNGFGLEAVAREARVGHTSVYRRWPSKAHLVHEVVFPADEVDDDVPEGADLETIVRGLVEGASRIFGRPDVMAATPGLLAEFHDNPELRAGLTDRIETRFRERLRAALPPDVDADLLLDAAAGAVMFSMFIDGRAARPGFAEGLVALLLGGVSQGR